jgi:hypothetical protein
MFLSTTGYYFTMFDKGCGPEGACDFEKKYDLALSDTWRRREPREEPTSVDPVAVFTSQTDRVKEYKFTGKVDTDTFILKLRNNTRATSVELDFVRMQSFKDVYNVKTIKSTYSGFMGIAPVAADRPNEDKSFVKQL